MDTRLDGIVESGRSCDYCYFICMIGFYVQTCTSNSSIWCGL